MKNLKKEPLGAANQEINARQDTRQRILAPADVAERLGVSERTALQLMSELPHICVSRSIISTRKRLRITEQTLEEFQNGKIKRKPYGKEEEEVRSYIFN